MYNFAKELMAFSIDQEVWRFKIEKTTGGDPYTFVL
jgi:hypothetical protein